MKTLSKQKAIEKLTQQLNLINELKKGSQDFFTWRRQTEMALENIFRDNPRHAKNFNDIRYAPSAAYSGMPSSVSEKAFQSGLQQARAILETCITEIQEYWDDEPQEKKDVGQNPHQIREDALSCFHPYVVQECAKLFLDNHYTQAIETSVKAVFEHLRKLTGLSGDGATLVQTAFSEQSPLLAFNHRKNQTERDEHIGFMDMLKAYYKGVRNPMSHQITQQHDEQKVFEYLAMASWFCRRMDEAKDFIDHQKKVTP